MGPDRATPHVFDAAKVGVGTVIAGMKVVSNKTQLVEGGMRQFCGMHGSTMSRPKEKYSGRPSQFS